ncbi:MAG: hypothetical protein ACK54P_18065, partial [Bacteroidota bacterium]
SRRRHPVFANNLALLRASTAKEQPRAVCNNLRPVDNKYEIPMVSRFAVVFVPKYTYECH